MRDSARKEYHTNIIYGFPELYMELAIVKKTQISKQNTSTSKNIELHVMLTLRKRDGGSDKINFLECTAVYLEKQQMGPAEVAAEYYRCSNDFY